MMSRMRLRWRKGNVSRRSSWWQRRRAGRSAKERACPVHCRLPLATRKPTLNQTQIPLQKATRFERDCQRACGRRRCCGIRWERMGKTPPRQQSLMRPWLAVQGPSLKQIRSQ